MPRQRQINNQINQGLFYIENKYYWLGIKFIKIIVIIFLKKRSEF